MQSAGASARANLGEAEMGADLGRAIRGFQLSQAISVASGMGIPDLLRTGSRPVAELASETGTNAQALRRLMRALAAFGVFDECDNDRFSLTEMGWGLCDQADRTLAPFARLFGSVPAWQAWSALAHSVTTGETAFEHVHGCDVWAYRTSHPEHGAIFDRAMAAGAARDAETVLKVQDFSRFQRIVDVGGGDGTFLSSILAGAPNTHGILFDRPNVTAEASRTLQARGVNNRCAVVSGDFFEAVPQGADAYVLKWILHDWNGKQCIAILRTIAEACGSSGRLFVIEHLVEPPNVGLDGKLLDLMMLVMTGGQERNSHEYGHLLSEAGFEVLKIVRTEGLLSVVEAAPAAGPPRKIEPVGVVD